MRNATNPALDCPSPFKDFRVGFYGRSEWGDAMGLLAAHRLSAGVEGRGHQPCGVDFQDDSHA